MTTATALPAVKAALLALADAAISDSTVEFCYGHPGTNRAKEIISVRDAATTLTWGPFGQRDKDENLTIELVVSCREGGTNQQTVTERAFDLLDLIDTALRGTANAPSITSTVVFGGINSVQLRESNPAINDMTKGRVAELFCTVTAYTIT